MRCLKKGGGFICRRAASGLGPQSRRDLQGVALMEVTGSRRSAEKECSWCQGKAGASSVRVSYEKFAVLRGGVRDQVEVEPLCEMSSFGTQRQNGVLSGSPHGESDVERLVSEKRCLDSLVAMGLATEGIRTSPSEPSIRIIIHTLPHPISLPLLKKLSHSSL